MVLFISLSLFFSLAGTMKTGDLTRGLPRGLDGPGTGAMRTGDLARGLPRPLDGPRAGAAALLDAPGAGVGGCGWGALNDWLQEGPVEGGRSCWS